MGRSLGAAGRVSFAERRLPSLRLQGLPQEFSTLIGHQDFRLFGAEGPPSLTQNHSDVTDVPQTQACALHPEGFAARGPRQTVIKGNGRGY